MLNFSSVMTNSFSSPRSQKIAVAIFFILLLLTGIFIYRDFGLTCDEPLDRNTAAANLKYILSIFASEDFARSFIPNYDRIVPLESFVDRDYGVTFHLPAYLIELIFYKGQFAEAFKARHLLNFLYVYAGLVALYAGCSSIFRSRLFGIAAVVLFLLFPRIFAESFYNGKDLIVVAFACMNLYTLSALLQKFSFKNVLLHALSTALIVDTRIIGLAFLATGCGIIAVRGILRGEIAKLFLKEAVYIFLSFALIVCFFPYLWADPLGRTAEVFANMAAFRHDGIILFEGNFVNIHALPKAYVPVWLGITLPPFLLAGFGSGVMIFLCKLLKNCRRTFIGFADQKLTLFVLFNLVIFFGSSLSVFVLHSTLYNGWRQLYFIYPSLIVLNLYALYFVLHVKKGRTLRLICTVALALYIAGALSSCIFIICNHPYQNVYFNILAKKPWTQYYDVDYWGNATHLAYENILKREQGTVRYCHESMIFRSNREGLPPHELDRLVRVPCSLAQYRINNFFGRDPDDYLRLQKLKGERVFELKAAGETVLEVIEGPASNK